jgi:hypothetical protein
MAVQIHECDNERKKSLPLSRFKILIVEGRDDCNFFRYFLKKLDLLNDIQIFYTEGKSNLNGSIESLVLQEPFVSKRIVSMGIVQDADGNAKKTFDDVVEILKKNDLPTPRIPFDVTSTKPKISILIMPNSDDAGEIEDLCLTSIEDTNEMKCVNQYFECLEKNGIKIPAKVKKVKLNVFLSSKAESCSIGVAAQKGHLNFEHSAFNQIKKCLFDLYR